MCIRDRVLDRNFVGGFTVYRVRLAQGDEVSVRAIAREDAIFQPGETLQLTVAPADCRPLTDRSAA